ncbi:hypothetical protein ACJVC5_08670 [Peredibacter sp. HCB2-198]|uniref:hypothetical protein n=1 Tax=Peredibacter sp. HCB2-198 TaxID=3383025 RepID=UPI0038B58A46
MGKLFGIGLIVLSIFLLKNHIQRISEALKTKIRPAWAIIFEELLTGPSGFYFILGCLGIGFFIAG